MDSRVDVGQELIKVGPPVGAIGLGFAGVPLADWVLLATLIYTTLLILHLLYKFGKDVLQGDEEDGEDG